ncbi:MAG: hypothetical protein RRX95_01020 [Oscillospiraceae bacterium]
MKKMLIAFLIGAILIGTGAGVMAIELSDWDYNSVRESLLSMPVTTVEGEYDVDFGTSPVIDIFTDYYSYRSSFADGVVKVEKDSKYKESILVQVEYRGEEPYINFSRVHSQDEEEKNSYFIYVDNESPHSIKQAMGVAKEMFENKVFYGEGAMSKIESIVIKTAYPEKIHMENN